MIHPAHDMHYVFAPPPTSGGPFLVSDGAYEPLVAERIQVYVARGRDFTKGFLSGFGGLRRVLAEHFLLPSSVDFHAANRALKRMLDSEHHCSID
jgi:hypothetical protein